MDGATVAIAGTGIVAVTGAAVAAPQGACGLVPRPTGNLLRPSVSLAIPQRKLLDYERVLCVVFILKPLGLERLQLEVTAAPWLKKPHCCVWPRMARVLQEGRLSPPQSQPLAAGLPEGVAQPLAAPQHLQIPDSLVAPCRHLPFCVAYVAGCNAGGSVLCQCLTVVQTVVAWPRKASVSPVRLWFHMHSQHSVRHRISHFNTAGCYSRAAHNSSKALSRSLTHCGQVHVLIPIGPSSGPGTALARPPLYRRRSVAPAVARLAPMPPLQKLLRTW